MIARGSIYRRGPGPADALGAPASSRRSRTYRPAWVPPLVRYIHRRSADFVSLYRMNHSDEPFGIILCVGLSWWVDFTFTWYHEIGEHSLLAICHCGEIRRGNLIERQHIDRARRVMRCVNPGRDIGEILYAGQR